MKKLMLLTAFAAGYVLGAKAGRERYEQIRRTALRIKNNPTVQETAHSAADKAREQAPVVGHKLADAAGTVADKAKHAAHIGSHNGHASDPARPGGAEFEDRGFPGTTS
ncbi:MAG: hypothetical protein JF565_10995 [Propionibacteriales bacterium]|nr:hypothetical protein [Propionibacteriales bacterium]